MNRASVFEWHKRFKEARESVSLPLPLPLIYTGASLIDGSAKGQYTITGASLSDANLRHTLDSFF